MSEELLQDRLPVKFQDVIFNFKHEIFVRIDMKHSYFSNYFIICLPSLFSVVKVIIELFVCQNIKKCSCIVVVTRARKRAG